MSHGSVAQRRMISNLMNRRFRPLTTDVVASPQVENAGVAAAEGLLLMRAGERDAYASSPFPPAGTGWKSLPRCGDQGLGGSTPQSPGRLGRAGSGCLDLPSQHVAHQGRNVIAVQVALSAQLAGAVEQPVLRERYGGDLRDVAIVDPRETGFSGPGLCEDASRHHSCPASRQALGDEARTLASSSMNAGAM